MVDTQTSTETDPPPGAPRIAHRQPVTTARRAVVKFGSSVLIDDAGLLDRQRIHTFAQALAAWRLSGRECVIVSSGAVAAGRGMLQAIPGPRPRAAVCAAVGQSLVTAAFQSAFAVNDLRLAQVLVDPRKAPIRSRATLEPLLQAGIVPLVNENDALTQIDSGIAPFDNDQLAAELVERLDADLLVLLTDVHGVFDRDPGEFPDARLLPTLDPDLLDLTEEEPRLELRSKPKSRKTKTRGPGRGGIRSKLRAASRARASGCSTIIADGRRPGVLSHLLGGEDIGTLVPAAVRRKS